MILAVTGGTGFVGKRLLKLAVERGHSVRALARKAQPASTGIEWVEGTLAVPGDLCTGADAVIHIAGTLNVRTRAEFEAGNIAGTQAVLDAAVAAGVRRFVHVSSLAAREPKLSMYGDSKAGGETIVRASDRSWAIVRPPAVYGPGDKETLELFRVAARGIAMAPARGRASYIHVDDLVAALLALAESDVSGVFEPDDGRPDGYDHGEIARLIGEAVGRPATVIRVPPFAMLAAAAGATAWGRLSGKHPKLSLDRARYFAHPDWVSRGPALPGWSPAIAGAAGFPATAAWYREAGWL